LAEHATQLLHQAAAHGLLTKYNAGHCDDYEKDRRERGHNVEGDRSAPTQGAVRDVSLNSAFQNAPHCRTTFKTVDRYTSTLRDANALGMTEFLLDCGHSKKASPSPVELNTVGFGDLAYWNQLDTTLPLSRLISLTANETFKAEAAEVDRILSAATRRGGETL
jgi:hypothetical protein